MELILILRKQKLIKDKNKFTQLSLLGSTRVLPLFILSLYSILTYSTEFDHIFLLFAGKDDPLILINF